MGSAAKAIAPIAGGVLGSLFLPGIGTALGIGGLTDAATGAATLLGSSGGAALGGAGGEALSGGSLSQDLTAGLEGGATAGLVGSTDVGNALGLPGSISNTVSSAITGGGTSGTSAAPSTVGGGTAPVSDQINGNISNATQTPSQVAEQASTVGSTAGGADNITQQFQQAAGIGSSNVPNQIAQAVGGVAPAAGSASGGSNILSWLGKNLNLLPLAGSAAQAIIGANQTPKGLRQLESSAATTLNTENQLINSEATGNLPPGQYSEIQNQLNDSISAIQSKYASMGLSGSTMEQQAIQQAQSAAQAQITNAAATATATGLTAAEQTDSVYQAIMNAVLGQNKELSSTLAQLASAASGGGGTGNKITVTTG